jgi:4-hydroxybenzoate polyprenyltransferase
VPPPGRPGPLDVGRGLIVACHPLPCIAVTAFAASWALAVGLSPARTALLAVAVLLGQLSIGWCNDWVDAPRDRAVGRRDKPVVQSILPVRLLGSCAVVALVGCAGASLALGVRPGLVHLVGVASGWAYDLFLKPTRASPMPYAVAFGSLPAVATLAASPARWPAAGILVGGALLGTAAHFANTVGDVDEDAATGVRGLPQRLGPIAALRISAALVALAGSALLTAATRAGPVPLGVLAAGVVLGACGAGLAGRLAGRGRTAFRLTLGAVALVVGGFLLTA